MLMMPRSRPFTLTEAEPESMKMEKAPGLSDNFGRNARTQIAEEGVVHCHNLPGLA